MSAIRTVRYHEQPNPDWKPYVDQIWSVLAEHLTWCATVDQFLDGFCFDLHPEREIRAWLRIADYYTKGVEKFGIGGQRGSAPRQRRKLFQGILRAATQLELVESREAYEARSAADPACMPLPKLPSGR